MRTTYSILFIVLLSFLTSCSDDGGSDQTIAPELSLNVSEIELSVSENYQIEATSNYPVADIVWSSSDESIVSVTEDGSITTKKGGEAVITASLQTVSKTCIIKVKPDIYVIGVELNDASEFLPVVWKNGSKTILSSESSQPSAIIEHNGEIHIFSRDGKHWVNNQLIEVYADAKIENAAVFNDDLYLVGTSNTQTAYWKNGTKTILEGGVYASDIDIAGSDIYISGAKSGYEATYWKNGEIFELTDGLPSIAYGIGFYNNSIYVSGVRQSSEINGILGVYWKDGESLYFPNLTEQTSSDARNVFKTDESFYMLYRDEQNHYLWKDESTSTLFNSAIDFRSTNLTVYDNEIYLSGAHGTPNLNEKPAYWHNNVVTELESGEFRSNTYDILVY